MTDAVSISRNSHFWSSCGAALNHSLRDLRAIRMSSPWAIICATWLAVALFKPLTPLRIDWLSFTPVFFASACLLLVYFYYHYLAYEYKISSLLAVVVQLLLFSCAGAIINYLGLFAHRPLIDKDLAAIDRALGFDWWAYVHFIKSEPNFATLLTWAYQSSQAQIILCFTLLAYRGQHERLRIFMMAFMLVVTILST
jgi:hypothetical protein